MRGEKVWKKKWKGKQIKVIKVDKMSDCRDHDQFNPFIPWVCLSFLKSKPKKKALKKVE